MAGASAGALLGALFSLITGTLRFGFGSLGDLSILSMLGSIGLATLGGCLLSLLGVLYPAWLAARMEPINAMRAEH